MAAAETRSEPGMRVYLIVWLGLIFIVGAEVRLTYSHLGSGTLLVSLLVLALVEAALGVMYFMHLRYERPALFWALIPYLIFALLMLNQLWPDAFRLLHLRAPSP